VRGPEPARRRRRAGGRRAGGAARAGTMRGVPPAPCPVCGARRAHAFTHLILGRHQVDFVTCPRCGLLQTEEPHWLAEAYSDPIAASDVGLVQRNHQLAETTACLLHRSLPAGPYLDAGAGYGLFVRSMRDLGFDFRWSDPYTENLFARGFEDGPGAGPYAAVTAFEVLEHVHDPAAWVRETLERAGASTLVFSQVLFDGPPPGPNWWYYVFHTGQHVSFYRPSTLDAIAAPLGLRRYSSGDLHVLTDRRLPRGALRVARSRLRVPGAMLVRARRAPLTPEDYARAVAATAGDRRTVGVP